MRKQLMIGALVCLMLVPITAFSAGTTSQGPKAYLPEPVYEFSPVVEGIEIVHQFSIINRGDAPLEILTIKSG